MKVRKGTIEDAELLWVLMQDAFSEYKDDSLPSSALQETPQMIEQKIEKGEQSFILYNDYDEPVGMVFYTIEEDFLYFSRLSIKRNEQLKGYAKKLLIELEKEALRNRIPYIKCKVRANGQRNMYLYSNLGYKQYGEEVINRNGIQLSIALFEKPLRV